MSDNIICQEAFIKEIAIANAEVDLLLDEPISDEPERVKYQIEQIEVYHNRISKLLCTAEKNHEVSRDYNMPDQSSPKDDLGRKVKMESLSSEDKCYFMLLKRKLDSIVKRIESAQSILAYYRESIKRL